MFPIWRIQIYHLSQIINQNKCTRNITLCSLYTPNWSNNYRIPWSWYEQSAQPRVCPAGSECPQKCKGETDALGQQHTSAMEAKPRLLVLVEDQAQSCCSASGASFLHSLRCESCCSASGASLVVLPLNDILGSTVKK